MLTLGTQVECALRWAAGDKGGARGKVGLLEAGRELGPMGRFSEVVVGSQAMP